MKDQNKNWSRRKFIKAGLLTGAAMFIADSFWAEKFFIETNEYFIDKDRSAKDYIKIVQVSDLHLQSVGLKMKRLAIQITTQQPDLILFTGDAIDKAENLRVLKEFLTLLDAKVKKAAILGNWEYWGKIDIGKLKELYFEHNCELLVNETSQFLLKNKTFTLTGLDDFVGGNADIKHALRNYQKSDYHVIMNHCPGYNDSIIARVPAEIKVDLILSGHTHSGQINLFGFAPFVPRGSGKYLKGWYEESGKKIYVSKGIGTSIIPARFLSQAEIAVFHFPLA